MYKVLVLGGEGMLGQMVVSVLSRSNQLTVEHTSRSRKSGYYYDVENGLDGLRQILEQNDRYDYVINCIGVISQSIDEQNSDSILRAILVNALFPHNLATLAWSCGSRVIHISTDGIFSGASSEPYFEDAPHDCVDIYGKTKSLGEVRRKGFLNIRCSIIGPDLVGKKGLLEWFLEQPVRKTLHGYIDHLWNGVTTLQYATLCQKVIIQDSFQTIWEESPVHHFCPNQPLSKYDLLKIFQAVFKRDVIIKPSSGVVSPVNRILATRYHNIKELFGYDLNIEQVVRELASWNKSV